MAPREPRCAQDGAAALLAGAIRYALGVCALVAPAEMSLPTPCPQWDLSMLLAHLSDSMADLEAAIRTGRLSVDPRDAASGDPGGDPAGDLGGDLGGDPAGDLGGDPAGDPGGDPVEVLRDRAAELLCSAYGFGGPERLVVVGGLPVPVGLVAGTGAVEIAVHGWDVSADPAAKAGPAPGHEPPGPVRSAGRGARRGQPVRPARRLPRPRPKKPRERGTPPRHLALLLASSI